MCVFGRVLILAGSAASLRRRASKLFIKACVYVSGIRVRVPDECPPCRTAGRWRGRESSIFVKKLKLEKYRGPILRTAAEEDVLRARISKVEGTKEVFEQEHCRLVHAAPRRVQ